MKKDFIVYHNRRNCAQHIESIARMTLNSSGTKPLRLFIAVIMAAKAELLNSSVMLEQTVYRQSARKKHYRCAVLG